jgi:signal transduction histidine kinase
MMEALRLYRRFVGIAIRSRMEYRSDFIVGFLSVISLNVVNLSIIWVLVSRFRVMAGWSFWEIVMLYATFLLGHSVYAVLFWHLTRLEDDIIHGRFDQYLVRPCSPLLQFLGREVNYMGVDVVAKERFRSFVQQLNREQQVTVMLTTHDMSDIEKICRRMMIIDQGKIVYDGAIAGMKEQLAPYRVLVVDFGDQAPPVDIEGVESIDGDGRRVRLRFDRRRTSASALITELAGRFPIKDISVEEPEIEEIVRGLYQHTASLSQPLSD